MNLSKRLFYTYKALPSWLAVFLANIVAVLRRTPVRFGWDRGSQFWFCRQNKRRWYFADPARGFIFYANGFRWRADFLSKQYFLDKTATNDNELLIDVGANYGDLGEFAASRNLKYIAIEPGTSEVSCIDRNIPKATILPYAAYSEAMQLKFFISESLGDSSVIKPSAGGYVESIVQARPLDDLLSDAGLGREPVGILKVEAEGAEPEVLMGASLTLKRTRWVAIEGGPERNGTSTLPACTNLLVASGFAMEEVNPKGRPGVALFRNLKAEATWKA